MALSYTVLDAKDADDTRDARDARDSRDAAVVEFGLSKHSNLVICLPLKKYQYITTAKPINIATVPKFIIIDKVLSSFGLEAGLFELILEPGELLCYYLSRYLSSYNISKLFLSMFNIRIDKYLETSIFKMPLRQIRKHKISKSKTNSHSRTRKTKTNTKHQRGGDPGRVALPMAYFSKNNTAGYYADGSDALKGCSRQKAVSHGVVWPGGNWAGPNLYPQLGGRGRVSQRGGDCGCRGSRRSKRKTQTRKH